MGNQPSRSTTPASNPQSPGVTSSSSSSHGPATTAHHHHHSHHHFRHGDGPSHATHSSHAAHAAHAASVHAAAVASAAAHPRRRESIQALSVKASAAPPSASFESAAAQSTSTRPHSRSRSQTIATSSAATTTYSTAVVNNPLHVIQTTLKSASEEKMGNEQSRQKGTPPKDKDKDKDKERERDKSKLKPTSTSSPSPPADVPAATQQLQQPTPSQQTQPVDVPSVPRDDPPTSRTEQHASSIEPADASAHDYFAPPPPQYSRPPRLPLPIEEEPHTPGSPIISPADLASPIDIDPETDSALPRRTSVLSSATGEDEELEEEFQPPAPGDVPTVPTLVEWEGPGERVYVTGTFAGWNRKYRLHRNGPSKKKDVLSAIISIAPGTHHLTFLVDNDMRTSDKLPTAVDYTNSLVNYLEVSYDDVPQPGTGATKEPEKTNPIPVEDQPAPPGIYPPQTLPPTPEQLPVKQSAPEPSEPKAPAPIASPKSYHSTIPYYLLDLDAPEESERFARANAAATRLPTPPTLPMFLSKSILNGTTPMKDDSSVLIMPNHTVLNHLATSSIKDNILATSATTRYRQKFLTTIMYKPKADSDHSM